MNYVYLANGSKRDIEVSDGRGIKFKNTAPKFYCRLDTV